jgi:hemolysin III
MGFFPLTATTSEKKNDDPPTKAEEKSLVEKDASNAKPLLLNSSSRTLPLSRHLMQAASFCCQACGTRNNGSTRTADEDNENDHNEDEPMTQVLGDYNLQLLKEKTSNTSVSPLLMAPMTMPICGSPKYQSIMESIIMEYMAACRFFGVGHRVNAGVLTTFRFSLPSLRVSGSFHDADMLALSEILLRYGNGPLKYIKRLDFSLSSKEGKLHGKAGFRSHGALTLSKVLQGAEHIEEVLLQRNRIGPYGAAAIFIACADNSSIKKIVMRRCSAGERGALAFAELVVTSQVTGLREVDISANGIGFKGSVAVEKALTERAAREDLHPMTVDMEGNLVFQEIMNGVTHGLGIMLAMIGSSLLSKRVQGMSHRHYVSCAIYSTSLIILYLSSTLFHSFSILRDTRYIFEVLDKCAIYILIAGSYTPFLQIVLAHEPLWSVYLLAFLWACCFLGIGVEMFFPTWKQKGLFSLAMYLGMGWSTLVCLPEVARMVPDGALHLMILGGVGYTAGVPFFVRNNNLDHAIWHLFVLSGSILHWFAIYFYVAPLELNHWS